MAVQKPVKIDIKVGDRITFKNEYEYERLGFPAGLEVVVEGITEDEHILQISFLLANRKNVINCHYDFCEVEKVKEPEVKKTAPA